MGRTSYTEEERRAIIASFISATRKAIDQDGIANVSIRKISNGTGYSSATLYLYFQDLDELVQLSLVGYLESYCRSLVDNDIPHDTPLETYLWSWRQFCLFTFRKPEIFNSLFFGASSSMLDEVVKRYYSIYPNQLDHLSGAVLSMVLSGNLHERNLSVLEPCASDLGISQERIELMNDITVSYYHDVLTGLMGTEPTDQRIQSLTERVLDAVVLILGLDRRPAS